MAAKSCDLQMIFPLWLVVMLLMAQAVVTDNSFPSTTSTDYDNVESFPEEETDIDDTTLPFIYSQPGLLVNESDFEDILPSKSGDNLSTLKSEQFSVDMEQSSVHIQSSKKDIISDSFESTSSTILDIKPTSVLSPSKETASPGNSSSSSHGNSRILTTESLSVIHHTPLPSFSSPVMSPIHPTPTHGIDASSLSLSSFTMSRVNTQPLNTDSLSNLSLFSTSSAHLSISSTYSMHLPILNTSSKHALLPSQHLPQPSTVNMHSSMVTLSSVHLSLPSVSSSHLQSDNASSFLILSPSPSILHLSKAVTSTPHLPMSSEHLSSSVDVQPLSSQAMPYISASSSIPLATSMSPNNTALYTSTQPLQSHTAPDSSFDVHNTTESILLRPSEWQSSVIQATQSMYSSSITATSTALLFSSSLVTDAGNGSAVTTGNDSTPDMVTTEIMPITEAIKTTATSSPSSVNISNVEKTTTPHMPTWKDSVYQFVFEGNCSLILASSSLKHSFLYNVKMELANELSISPDRIDIGPIHCGSIIVNVTVENTDDTRIDDQIMEIIASGNFSFSINTTDSVGLLAFQAAGVKVLVSPYVNSKYPTSRSPTQTKPLDESLLRGFWELSETERILIIVFSVLGGFLFIIALAYIIHVCCLKGHTKSFELGDTPDHQVKLEDFTLTKLQRPPTIYDEHGMILTEDLHPGQTKMAIPYIPHAAGSCCHGHGISTFRESPVVMRRPNNCALRGSAENLVIHHQLPPKDKDGIDNMSFSSDDILGEGGSSDLETDNDDSPRRQKPRNAKRKI